MKGRQVLRTLLVLWAAGPLALALLLCARLALHWVVLGDGVQWRVVESGGGPVPGPDAHDEGFENVLVDESKVWQQLAKIEVVTARSTESIPALLLEVSDAERRPRVRALRSRFFKQESLNLEQALETTLARHDDPRPLVRVSERDRAVRLVMEAGPAYAEQSAVKAIVVERR